MSEKFGLDWQDYPNDRVQDLISVHVARNKKQEIENKKSKLNKK